MGGLQTSRKKLAEVSLHIICVFLSFITSATMLTHQIFDVVQNGPRIDSLFCQVGPERRQGPLVTLPHLGVLIGQVGAAVLVNTVVRQVSEHVGERAEEEDVKMIYRSNSVR
jgi:hypothetical protein